MWLHALVWASLAVCPILGHSPSPPVVDTTQGKVLGKYISLEGSAQPVAVFLGVPFAKPPLGSLRFAPPQPAEPWSFVKNVTSYPPMCYQDAGWEKLISDMFSTAKEILPLKFSEDCLYLNIYSPADLTKGSPLPVLSPLGKDLFHRAISESGVVITTNLGKKNIQATNEYNISLSTVIDGVVLPKAPEEILAEKSFNTVPYIVGFNKQEFGWIIPLLRLPPRLEPRHESHRPAPTSYVCYVCFCFFV